MSKQSTQPSTDRVAKFRDEQKRLKRKRVEYYLTEDERKEMDGRLRELRENL